MNQAEAVAIVAECVIDNFFRVQEVLKSVVGIPAAILGIPEELRGYVNEQRTLDFTFTKDSVYSSQGNYASKWEPLAPLSASFSPYPPRLCVNTEVLQGDAEVSGLDETALLEILLLHELVHVAMMSNFVGDSESIWLKSGTIRFIHESVALRACEFCFSHLYSRATAEDVTMYLKYVQQQSEQSLEPEHYIPYFTKFRGLKASEFWPLLSGSSPIPLPFL